MYLRYLSRVAEPVSPTQRSKIWMYMYCFTRCIFHKKQIIKTTPVRAHNLIDMCRNELLVTYRDVLVSEFLEFEIGVSP